MPTYYAQQQVGVADGTKNPADRPDGRQVGAKESVIVASKVAGQAWAAADKIFVGRLRAGDMLRRVYGVTDTSFATATLSLGTLAAPTKYINVKTLTVIDIPTMLGISAVSSDDGPLVADEDLYLTIGTAGVAGAVNATFDLEIVSIK